MSPTRSRQILDTNNRVYSDSMSAECADVSCELDGSTTLENRDNTAGSAGVEEDAAASVPSQPSDVRGGLAVRDGRLQRVLEIIQAQPSQSVRALALEVRLSPAHLQRLFRQQTGVHIRDLIVEGRLQKAATLLSASTMQIKDIAYTVGYQHHSSFVRAFQRRFAQAPRHYRRHGSARD